MKPRLIIGLLVFALIATTACNFSVNLGNRVSGSGNIVTEERSVSDFNNVALNGAGELYIEQGETEALTVEADDNLMQYITTEVKGSTLELGLKPNLNLLFSAKIVYHLKVKDLNSVSISGSGKVYSDSIQTGNLNLSTSGSGKFEIGDVQATKLDVSTSGSGEFVLSGKADQVDVSIGGSGKFNCPDLEAKTVAVSIAGSGEVTTWATNSLEVHISGSGNVRYYGNPVTNQSIAGSGKVSKIGDK